MRPRTVGWFWEFSKFGVIEEALVVLPFAAVCRPNKNVAPVFKPQRGQRRLAACVSGFLQSNPIKNLPRAGFEPEPPVPKTGTLSS